MSVRGQHQSPTGRNKFTVGEDTFLKNLVQVYGKNDWKKISSLMPGRNPKQCRDRWSNYLSEDRKTEPWTQEEDQILLDLYQEIGPKWVQISKKLKGRSGNDAKNRWYKHLNKNCYTADCSEFGIPEHHQSSEPVSDSVSTAISNAEIGLELNVKHNSPCNDASSRLYSIESLLI